MTTIEQLFAGLQSPELQQEVVNISQVTDTIMADAGLDQAFVYTGFGARYSARSSKPGTIVQGAITPNQVIPVWRRTSAGGKHRAWLQETALQLTAWSAVVYEGKLWLANTDAPKQNYDLRLGAAALASKFASGRDMLMAPGGRVQTNVWEDFPCATPFQHTPMRELRPRVVNAMTPSSWLSIFGQSAVLDAERPSWRLVELVNADKGDKGECADGCSRLFDPISGSWVQVRDLPLPVGLEFAELILENVDPSPMTLRELIYRGIEDYFANHGDPQCVGFAWYDDEGLVTDADGNSISGEAHASNVEATRKFVYRTELDENHRFDYRRLGSASSLSTFQNGGYEPDL